MIKSEIRSSVLNRLQRYDKTAKFHARVIDAECEAVLHTMLGEVFRMSPHSLQRYTRGYGYSTPLAVLYEASSAIYYTTLPESVIVLPWKASGVIRVASAVQTGGKFYPMDQREWDLMQGGSYVDNVKNKIGYAVTPTRVEYYGITGAILASGVRMDCLIPFSKYTDTDTVPYPDHVDGNGLGFIDRVVEKMKDKPKVDLLDDNKDEE
jgi:hypothetical protein